MKGNFLLEKKQRDVFETLTDEEAGILIKGIFRYLDTGDSGLKGLYQAIFVPIKKSIDKNEENYKRICERNRENGLKGGRPRKTENNPVGFSETQNNLEKPDARHISYINNHISNNHLEDKGVIGGKETFNVASDGSLLSETTKKVIDRLNELAGTSYRVSSNSTRAKIQARLNEGYKLDDFIVVIENKVRDWKNTDMAKYLRPETLFGNKFEGYLNQNKKNNSTDEKPWWYSKDIEEETATEEEMNLLEEQLNGSKRV